MVDLVSHVDLRVTTLMQDSGGSQKVKPLNEFNFRSNCFDDKKFFYNHLNATEDVEKVKTIWAQQLTQIIRAYLIRCGVMIQGLFEVDDANE